MSSRWSVALLSLSLSCPLCLEATPAHAQESAPDPKTEARDRFGRGLRLFNDGDNAGALAEFKRAHELAPHPVVAYNIGLVYAAMGRAIEAVDTLDEVLKSPGTLSADKLEKARRTRAEQALRIAELSVKANVEGAEVEIDGINVEKLPLTRALKVTSGSRVVGVTAPGHIPERREVTLAGGIKKELVFELRPFEGRLAQLVVRSSIPGAVVSVDGKRVGVTPLSAPVVLAPGKHNVQLERAGYSPVSQAVELGDAVKGEVTLEPAIDPTKSISEGGRLALDLSEPECSFSVNGRPQGKYTGGLRVPAGPHLVRVERDGFEPVERLVDVAKGGTTSVRIVLEPTPEYRQRYEKKASLFKTWGWVGVIGGAVVTGVGTGYLIWNQGKKDEYIDEGNYWKGQIDLHNANQSSACKDNQFEYCNQRLETAVDSYDRAKARDLFGWLAVGVGGAALVTGSVLLITGDDPDRYTHERPELAKPRWAPMLALGPDGGALVVGGAF